MKFHTVSAWGSIAVTSLVMAQQLAGQALPQWTPEDRARLKKGEIIAGASLLVDSSPIIKKVKPKVEPEVFKILETELIPEPFYDPQLIPEDFFSAYFMERPAGYLVDPQHLLSRQETLDREGFLAYHAEESKIDIKLYLFDEEQVIPEEFAIERLAYEQYADTDLTAVVFCFIGDPARNELAFGGKKAEQIKSLELRRILDDSVIKAMEKSDLAAQVEAFSVELSIKLYWMEEDIMVSDAGAAQKEGVRGDGVDFEFLPIPKQSVQFVGEQLILSQLIIAGASLGMIALGGAGMIMVWRRSRRYQFPVLEIPQRLGADYAAGIGAVLSFHDKYGSPSNQREQNSDYLARV